MSGDSVADDIIRAGYDRWKRLEEEKSAIGDDLKELFAELKGQGFAPKALRESFRRVRNINDASQQEHDAIVDLYVAALTGARPARTREDEPEHDADGVIIEPQAQPAQTEPSGRQTAPTTNAGAVAVEAPATNSNSTPDCPIGEEAGEAETGETLSASPANNQAETPTERLDDLGSVQDGRKMSTDGQTNGLAGPADADDDQPANIKPAPHSESAGSSPAVSDEGGAPSVSLVAANSDAAPVDRTKPNPWCQDPDDCGVVASWDHMCGACLRLRAERQAVEAVQ